MDFLYGLAFNLLLKLLFDKPAVYKTEPPCTPPVQTLKVEAPQKIEIPEWVTNIPANGFVGISGLCQSIEEARQQALESAVSQILQAMGAEYNLSHKSIISGTAHDSRHELRERLVYTAKWFVAIQTLYTLRIEFWVSREAVCVTGTMPQLSSRGLRLNRFFYSFWSNK